MVGGRRPAHQPRNNNRYSTKENTYEYTSSEGTVPHESTFQNIATAISVPENRAR
jgi:hypothetical protein